MLLGFFFGNASIMKINIFWFRRDLRMDDNVGLQKALSEGTNVLPIFIFDKTLLASLPSSYDRRVDYIHQALEELHKKCLAHGSRLHVYHGDPIEVFDNLTKDFEIETVFCNHDYEPKAIARDESVKGLLRKKGIAFQTEKDQVIFEKDEVIKADGLPYTVFTPYAKKWKMLLEQLRLGTKETHFDNLYKTEADVIISLSDLGFEKTDEVFKLPRLDKTVIQDYHLTRDFPAVMGTTRLGMALRFGTISIRTCVRFAQQYNQTWLNELIWREFFMQLLFHFPHVETRCFKQKYDAIPWRNNESEFQKWCDGETGYPLVDAGMLELKATGFMHNRVRMVCASFLCKHLLIDWRWGETYFAGHLLDYDLSANNGNWQWAAGCGADAAPYFRVFNPTIQLKKFDPKLEYVKKWNPEYEMRLPMVDHDFARKRAISVYKESLM